MREKKSAEEIEEMERAFEIGYRMHTLAMQMCRRASSSVRSPAPSRAWPSPTAQGLSFPSIVSQHGETLHNLHCDGVLEEAACCCATPAPRR